MNHVPQLFADTESILFVAGVLIQATLVIVLALVSGHLLRRQPLLRHTVLLGGLMCACFCPAASYVADRTDVSLISISWSSSPRSHSRRMAPSSASREDRISSPVENSTALASPPPALIDPDTEPGQPAPERVAIAPESSLPRQSPTLPAGNEMTHGFSWTAVANVAGLIWLAGIAVIAIRLLLAWRYLSRLRSGATSLDEQSLSRLRKVGEKVLQAVPVKRLPPLLVSDLLKGPISLGLFRPVIILPRKMAPVLNASQLRDVLIHETAHIHRRDHFVVLMQRLAGAFFWPFPLVWKLNSKIDEAREDICDNYVLRRTEASQYSRMLLELTERAAPPRAIPLAIGLWQCPRKLEQRVTVLLDPRRTTATRLPRPALCTVAVAFVSIVVLLAGLQFTPASNVQAAETRLRAREEEPNSLLARRSPGSGTQPKQLVSAAPVPEKNQHDPLMPVAIYGDARFRYGHSISSLCFSPNGKLLASSSRYWGTALWHTGTGELIRHFSSDHPGPSAADHSEARFSPDGRLLVVASNGLKVWDVANGELLYRIENAGQYARHNRGVQFTRDGLHFLTVGTDAVLFIEADSGAVVSEIPTGGETTRILGVALSPDGSRVIVATTTDGKYALKTWDPRSGEEVPSHSRANRVAERVTSLRFTPDGQLLAAVTYGRRFQVLDPQTLAGQKEYGGHKGDVRSYEYTPDGKLLALGSGAGSYFIRLIDPVQDRPIREWRVGSGDDGLILAISPDGKTIASAVDDSAAVKLWDAATSEEKFPYKEGRATTFRRMVILPDGQTLITQDYNGRVYRRDLKTGGFTREEAWPIPDASVSVGMSSGACELWKSDWRRMAREPQLKDSDLVADLNDHRILVREARVSADGNRVALQCYQTQLRVYDRHSGERLRQFGDTKTIASMYSDDMALSADGSRVVYRHGPKILAWNVETGRQLPIPPSGSWYFAPDGTVVVPHKRGWQLWDMDEGKSLGYLDTPHPTGPVAFSPDGKFMAARESRGQGNTGVVVWDLATRKVIRALGGLRGGATALCFSPEGRTLCATDASTLTLVWDLSHD